MATSTKTTSAPSETGRMIPPLRNGDHLTADEFLRRYDAMPHLKKAELIDGRVYLDSPDSYPTVRGDLMASPVSFEEHSAPHFDLITWLGLYRSMTRGVRGGDNGTIRFDPKTLPQPDALLLILPSHGGQARIGDDKFVQGAPELVAEVAYSSVSYDLHEKLEIFERNGVREYIAWLVEDRSIEWFVLRGGRFERLAPGEGGIYRSEVFPGLWLDPLALVQGDMESVMHAAQQGLATPQHAEFAARLRDAARPQ